VSPTEWSPSLHPSSLLVFKSLFPLALTTWSSLNILHTLTCWRTITSIIFWMELCKFITISRHSINRVRKIETHQLVSYCCLQKCKPIHKGYDYIWIFFCWIKYSQFLKVSNNLCNSQSSIHVLLHITLCLRLRESMYNIQIWASFKNHYTWPTWTEMRFATTSCSVDPLWENFIKIIID
jgi:hypothetical protein